MTVSQSKPVSVSLAVGEGPVGLVHASKVDVTAGLDVVRISRLGSCAMKTLGAQMEVRSSRVSAGAMVGGCERVRFEPDPRSMGAALGRFAGSCKHRDRRNWMSLSASVADSRVDLASFAARRVRQLSRLVAVAAGRRAGVTGSRDAVQVRRLAPHKSSFAGNNGADRDDRKRTPKR